MKSLDYKIAQYVATIQKIGDLGLLSQVKKAQAEAEAATKKARELYQKFIQSKN